MDQHPYHRKSVKQPDRLNFFEICKVVGSKVYVARK